jgi:hypothetical protein
VSRNVVLLCSILLIAACENGVPSAPSSGLLDGTWSGSIVSATIGGGELTLTMTQIADGRPVSGTWRARFTAEGADRRGSVRGSTVGSGVTLALEPDSSVQCPSGGIATPTIGVSGDITGERITGSYASFACGAVDTGSIDVAKRP